MTVESWQIIHIAGVFLGLLIGWMFNPWLGTAFIWAFVIAVEALSFWEQRRMEKVSGEIKHRASRA